MESAAVLWLLGCCSILLSPAAGEVFSAVTHMEKLVVAELELAQSLEGYIVAEEARLNRIRTIGQLVSNVSEAANADIGRYLGHPVNAYRLLRRFISDWKEIENLVAQPATSEGTQLCVGVDMCMRLAMLMKRRETGQRIVNTAWALAWEGVSVCYCLTNCSCQR